MTVVVAHGLGGRTDLPVPLWLALYAGAAAVLVSFVALTVLWKTPKLRGVTAGRPLPAVLTSAVDARVTRFSLRLAGLLLFAVFLVTAWAGPDTSSANPAAAWFYVWFWVGLVPLSLLAGPVWRALNPLRALASALRRWSPLRPGGAWSRPLPERIGYTPAIVGLLAFLWLELASGHSDSPRLIAGFVTLYAIAHVIAGAVFGERWFDNGDGFEVYAVLIAALSPFGRRADGRLVVRNPLDGLLTIARAPGLTPLVLVVLGSTAFDGLTRLPFWSDLTRDAAGLSAVLGGTAGLAAAIVLTGLAYRGGVYLTRPYLRRSIEPYGEFAHSLIPIMVGYTIAHYFSFAVFDGQRGVLQGTDPLGRGWDLFAVGDRAIDYTVVSTGVIALVQVAGIVVGHVLAVVSAHDRAIGVLRPKYLTVGQYPLLALMVGYTAVGIALVSGA